MSCNCHILQIVSYSHEEKKNNKKFCNTTYQELVTYAAHLVISAIMNYFYKDQIDSASAEIIVPSL